MCHTPAAACLNFMYRSSAVLDSFILPRRIVTCSLPTPFTPPSLYLATGFGTCFWGSGFVFGFGFTAGGGGKEGDRLETAECGGEAPSSSVSSSSERDNSSSSSVSSSSARLSSGRCVIDLGDTAGEEGALSNRSAAPVAITTVAAASWLCYLVFG